MSGRPMPTLVEPITDDRVLLRVEVSAHDVDHAFEHALRDLARDVRIPGFRKGKVPPRVLRSRLGDEAVVEEALRGHLGSWYARAVRESGIEPADQPEIDYDDPPAEGAAWTFTATVAVPKPAVLPDDLKVEAPRPSADVPEDAIERELERIRGTAAQLEPTQSPVGVRAIRQRVHQAQHAPGVLGEAALQRAKDAFVQRMAACDDRAERKKIYQEMHGEIAAYRSDHADALARLAREADEAEDRLAAEAVLRDRTWPWPIYPRTMLLALKRAIEAKVAEVPR